MNKTFFLMGFLLFGNLLMGMKPVESSCCTPFADKNVVPLSCVYGCAVVGCLSFGNPTVLHCGQAFLGGMPCCLYGLVGLCNECKKESNKERCQRINSDKEKRKKVFISPAIVMVGSEICL